MTRVRALVRAGTARLHEAGLARATHEVEWLLGRLLGVSRTELYVFEGAVPEPVARRFWTTLHRRAGGAPLQYLLRETEFFGASFAVAPGVFIPRPETETVVQAALDALRALEVRWQRPLRLVDLGIGSGCIAVTLARRLPTCVVVGVELSWDALRIARINIRRHGVASRVLAVQGSWLSAIRGAVDGIISNPPYVPSGVVDQLPLDVRREPRVSLDGGPDGLEALRDLVGQAPRVLRPLGVLVLECGEEHVDALLGVARGAPWVQQAVPLADLAGRPRGILATRAEARSWNA